MKDSELKFDHTCHVLYSQKCREVIQKKIALHYPKDRQDYEWEKVQNQYVTFLSDFRKDLGGKKNFHNRTAGTYDCIALMSYYVICKENSSVTEMEEMNNELLLPSFQKLSFVNCNQELYRKLLDLSFKVAEKKCQKWNDYEMKAKPYIKGGPVRYEFTACPIAQFAKDYDLLEVLPSFCNGDYAAMELLHAKLIRNTTCGNGNICDYTIYGDEDKRLQEYVEYVDEEGYRRNRKVRNVK